MEIRPQTPNFGYIFLNFDLAQFALTIRFQRALNDFPIFIQTQIRAIFVFWDRNAQIWKFGPRPPIVGKKNYFDFTLFCLPIRFQRALDDFHKLIFDHFMNLFPFLPFWAHCAMVSVIDLNNKKIKLYYCIVLATHIKLA